MTEPNATGLFTRLQLRPDSAGLIPAVVQDAVSGEPLMVAFMNEEALAATYATNRSHFYSRDRQKLWRKGEISGHEQIVEGVYVNCEANCLLLKVRQIGAVCHDGYATCFYRRLDGDGSTTIVGRREFDPAVVYSRPAVAPSPPPAPVIPSPSPPTPIAEPAPTYDDEPWPMIPASLMPRVDGADAAAAPMERLTRLLYGALTYLRDHDLSVVSKTSQRLWREQDTVSSRVADELRELAGAIDGSHSHRGFEEDVKLEGTQVLYWTFLSALRNHISFDWLRPDLALETVDPGAGRTETAHRIRTEAERWERGFAADEDHGINCHAALVLVGQACHVAGMNPLEIVETDLAEMRGRRYLAAYFAEEGGR